MDSITNYNSYYTTFIIAHRYSTVMKCDRLIKMKNGTIERIGTPEEIISKLSWFIYFLCLTMPKYLKELFLYTYFSLRKILNIYKKKRVLAH